MEATQNKATSANLPVIDTLKEAWKTVIELKSRLAMALLIPFSIAAAVECYAVAALDYDPERYPLWVMCVLGMMLSIAAVSCHRIVLLGNESVGEYGVSATQASLWRYIGRCLLMGMVLFFVVAPIVMLATPILIGLNIDGRNSTLTQGVLLVAFVIPLGSLFALVFGQLSLTLPAAAIAKSLGFVDAFELARGNAWKVALLVFGAPFVIEVLISISGGLVPSFLFVLVQLLLKWLTLPFEIVILSLCYKRLAEAREVSTTTTP